MAPSLPHIDGDCKLRDKRLELLCNELVQSMPIRDGFVDGVPQVTIVDHN